MKILLIDDEPGILHVYGDKLTNAKFETLLATNGDEGIKLAVKEKPNLILLDIIMPKLNGLDVLKQLKTQDDTKLIPVVLLTNLPSEMSAAKATSLGATGYLVKAEHDPSAVIEYINKTLASNK